MLNRDQQIVPIVPASKWRVIHFHVIHARSSWQIVLMAVCRLSQNCAAAQFHPNKSVPGNDWTAIVPFPNDLSVHYCMFHHGCDSVVLSADKMVAHVLDKRPPTMFGAMRFSVDFVDLFHCLRHWNCSKTTIKCMQLAHNAYTIIFLFFFNKFFFFWSHFNFPKCVKHKAFVDCVDK